MRYQAKGGKADRRSVPCLPLICGRGSIHFLSSFVCAGNGADRLYDFDNINKKNMSTLITEI